MQWRTTYAIELGEREREREKKKLYLQSRHTGREPPIYAGAYVTVHNNAHIEKPSKKTNNVYTETESSLGAYRW